MSNKLIYGCIGEHLPHSFSKEIHGQIGGYAYELKELTPEELPAFMAARQFRGINVTIPYKQAVIPYLDRLDDTAKAIGAVNVVYKRVGYNTDCLGFMDSVKPLLRTYDRHALVLGTGGASKAVVYGLRQLGITPTLVSRTPREKIIGYADLTEEIMQRNTVIVNCTPLGMLPDIDTCPDIPYQWITARHLLYDCVYNPELTLFLQKGKAQGATIHNGMEMLTGQAKAAWKIWNDEME